MAGHDLSERLRELHEDYVWQVNAAIGEGREDLVARLVDEYPGAALRLLTEGPGVSCDRPGCAACAAASLPAGPAAPPPANSRTRALASLLRARRRR
jgi:hypothetical protein